MNKDDLHLDENLVICSNTVAIKTALTLKVNIVNMTPNHHASFAQRLESPHTGALAEPSQNFCASLARHEP